MNSSSFQTAVDDLIDHFEGTVYTNYASDYGGPTKFGITLDDLRRWRNRGRAANDQIEVTAEDVRDMPRSEAEDIYLAWYWEPQRLGEVNDPVLAQTLFNQGVLRGIGTMGKTIQQVIGVPADGSMGPVTIAAINSADGHMISTDFMRAMENQYIDIVVNDRSQIVNLKGWMNRCHDLEKRIEIRYLSGSVAQRQVV